MLTTFLLAAVTFGTCIDINRNKFHDGENAMSFTTMAAFPSAESELSITTSSTSSSLKLVVDDATVIHPDVADQFHRIVIEEVETNKNGANDEGELGLPMLCDSMMKKVQNVTKSERTKKKRTICRKRLSNKHKMKFAGVVVGKKVMKMCPILCGDVISKKKKKKKKQDDVVGQKIQTTTSSQKTCPDMTGKYPFRELGNVLCSDDGYDDEQKCQYNYVYTGCTWEELKCEVPTVICTCNDAFFNNGKWSCLSRGMQRCPPTLRTVPPRIPTRRSLSTTQTSSSSFEQQQQQQQHDDRVGNGDRSLQQSSCEPFLPTQGTWCNPEEPLPTPCD